MKDEGINLLGTVQSVRSYFEDIAKLIETADTLMRELGWSRFTNYDQVVGGFSQTAKYPRNWMPFELVRFYVSTAHPGILTAISVIIDDRDDIGRIHEPLVSGIVVDYGRDGTIGTNWDWPYGSLHLCMPAYSAAVTNNGQILTAKQSEIGGFLRLCESVSTFARPLVDITDGSALKTNVVMPLTTLAGEASTRRT